MFLALFLLAPTAIAAVVEKALDGDSLLLADGRQVRLIGVNAPELGHSCHTLRRSERANATPNRECIPAPEQPLARAAQRRTAALVEGKRVRLEAGREEHDRHGRTLAHVYVGSESLEEILLREGLAWQVAIPPNVSHAQRLRIAEDVARTRRLGVWGEPAYRPMPAEQISSTDTGFRLVSGRVRRFRDTKHAYVFEMADRFVMLIPHDHWKDYFATDPRFANGPKVLVGGSLRVRGWITERDGEWRVRVGHPAMLDSLD